MTLTIDSTPAPAELRARPQWVLWRNEDGRKIPRQRNGKKASSTNPETWTSYERACRAYTASLPTDEPYNGIGYVFTADDPYTGIDLDDCIDDAGELAHWARTIVDTMQTYTEVSPSGTGLKLWVIGSIPRSVKTAQIEIYTQSRYFTVTGQQLAGTPDTIRNVNGELSALCESLRPAPIQPAHQPTAARAIDDDHARRYALGALESEHQAMLAAGDNERHNQRIKSAHGLAGYLPHITEEEITAALAVNFGPNVRNAMKTIADGIKSGRQFPRDIPPPKEREVTTFRVSTAISEETIADNPEAEHWRLVAQYWQEQAEMLEGWRAWMMDVTAIPTERLSPAAKVAAFALWPEMQSRAEQGITEPKRILIEETSAKTGLSAGTQGSKIKELASVGAIERIEDRQDNGHKKILIQPTMLWATPADWQPEAPRKHGGTDRNAGRRPVPVCPSPTCTSETPVIQERQTATRYLCGGCGKPLGHTYGKVHRHTWRPNNHLDCRQVAGVEDDANNQVAQTEDNSGPPPINQIEGRAGDTQMTLGDLKRAVDLSDEEGIPRIVDMFRHGDPAAGLQAYRLINPESRSYWIDVMTRAGQRAWEVQRAAGHQRDWVEAIYCSQALDEVLATQTAAPV